MTIRKDLIFPVVLTLLFFTFAVTSLFISFTTQSPYTVRRINCVLSQMGMAQMTRVEMSKNGLAADVRQANAMNPDYTEEEQDRRLKKVIASWNLKGKKK